MKDNTQKINRLFDLISNLKDKDLSNILMKIDSIIFMMLIQESLDELEKIKDNISTKRIDNKKLDESGTFEKSNRGGDDFYKSLINWNNEIIKDDYHMEIVLKEKIKLWKLSVRIHEKPYSHDYTLLKPKEKIEVVRTEVNLKSEFFHFKLFQVIGPVIYFNVLKHYKFVLKTISSQEGGYSHYAKNSTNEDTRNYYEQLLNENQSEKINYESFFNELSIEFFNLYSQE